MWKEGNQQAADELARRYTQRLVALARTRLPDKLSPRVDAEDVVQSAYGSFFRIAREGDHVVQPGDDLWQCLATITVHKVQKKIRLHCAGKRSVDREQAINGWADDLDHPIELMVREPSAEEQVTLIDELERGMRTLKEPLHRRMVEMILQGHPNHLVAESTQRTERMVRVVWKTFRDQLHRRLSECSEAEAAELPHS